MKRIALLILTFITIVSCDEKKNEKVTESDMKSEIVELNKAVLHMLSKGEVEKAIPYFADDITLNLYGFKTIKGKEEASKFFREIEYDKNKFVVKNYIVQGNTIAVEGTSFMTDENNNTSESFYCDVYRFENSKIKELSSYFVYIPPKAE